MIFQLSGPLLDACVLAILSKEDTYGYLLTSEIKKVMEVSDSTMYPVLKRLQKEGYVTTYDKPYQGRNRRYYHLTPQGEEQRKIYLQEWTVHKNKISQLLQGEDDA